MTDLFTKVSQIKTRTKVLIVFPVLLFTLMLSINKAPLQLEFIKRLFTEVTVPQATVPSPELSKTVPTSIVKSSPNVGQEDSSLQQQESAKTPVPRPQPTPIPFVVLPGKFVGNFSLGMTKEEVLKIAPKPQENTPQRLAYRSKKTGNVLRAHFEKNRLVQIDFTSKDFSTEAGIHTGNFRDEQYTALFDVQALPETSLRRTYTLKTGGLTFYSDPDVPSRAIGVVHASQRPLNEVQYLAKVVKDVPPTKQASVPKEESRAIEKDFDKLASVDLDKIFISGDTLAYAGYDIERSFDQKQKTSSVTVKKDGKILVHLDSGCCWKDSTKIGLFSFLGEGTKQIILEQFSGGASCCYSYKIYELLPHLRLIFDDRTYSTGHYSLDVEGKEKIMLIRIIRPLIANFCNACAPATIAVFLYDGNLGQYVLANKNFANYILQRQHSQRIKNGLDENEKREILSAFLDYVYVGRAEEAWQLYNSKYTGTDKEELRQNILRELQSNVIYNAIYGR